MHKRQLLFCLILFASCRRDGCPLGAGSTASETRDLAPFSQVILYDKINLVLTQDSTPGVQVSAGKNLLPGIRTQVSNGVLTIRDNNTCILPDPSEQATVSISSDQLQKISYYGAGDIHSTNTLLAGQFMIDAWQGSGTIRMDLHASTVSAQVHNENATIILTGAADSAFVYCSEAGAADLSGLTSRAVRVYSTTIRDIYVDVSNVLYTGIAYKGNVYYKGFPSVIDTTNTGSGKLIYLP
ncbi:MAG TPA: DUF2807 domain-containing protein [Puia sp.]